MNNLNEIKYEKRKNLKKSENPKSVRAVAVNHSPCRTDSSVRECDYVPGFELCVGKIVYLSGVFLSFFLSFFLHFHNSILPTLFMAIFNSFIILHIRDIPG